MSDFPGTGAMMPAAGHTDERGNWHWGTPAARAERIADYISPPPEPKTPREELIEAALTIEDTTHEQEQGME